MQFPSEALRVSEPYDSPDLRTFEVRASNLTGEF